MGKGKILIWSIEKGCGLTGWVLLAVYRMAAVLAEGTASRENILLLKEALEIFPLFHEEIRGILTGLGGGTENSPAG